MRRLMALLMAGFLVLAFTGCSSDKKDTEASTGATAAASSDEGAKDDGGSDSKSSGGDCPTQTEVDEINAAVGGPDDPSTMDTDQMVSDLKDAVDTMGEYIPSDLEDQFATFTDALESYLEVLSGVDLSDPTSMTPEQITALEEAAAAMDAPEVAEASAAIEEYFAEACPDIDFG